jgi:hypothetical protein
MFELIHKVHTLLNEVRGLEAGYTSAKLNKIYIRLEDEQVYEVLFIEIGSMRDHDMSDHFDTFPNETSQSTFQFTNRIVDVLEMFKDFRAGYTTRNLKRFMLEFKNTLYEAQIKELGEGEIQDFIK